MFSVFRDLIRYNTEFAIGLIMVGLVVILACLSFVSPVDPTAVYRAPLDQPPSLQYWFGTNSRGQDMFWQLSFAFRSCCPARPDGAAGSAVGLGTAGD